MQNGQERLLNIAITSLEDDNSSPWESKRSTRGLGHALIDLGMCLEVVNGRMWCLTDQETSRGQRWLDQESPTAMCLENTFGSPDPLRSCLVPRGRAPGPPRTWLCHPWAARTSPVTLTSIALPSADDMIRSDGCSNACSAGEVRARWDRRGDAGAFPRKVSDTAGTALAFLQATAECQNGSRTINVMGKVHYRSITATHKRENSGCTEWQPWKVQYLRFQRVKFKPELWQYPVEIEMACIPFPFVWLGGWLYNLMEKKGSQRFKEALDQALNAFSFYPIHISNRALWSE